MEIDTVVLYLKLNTIISPNYFNNNNIFMEKNFINRLDDNNINYNGFLKNVKLNGLLLMKLKKTIVFFDNIIFQF